VKTQASERIVPMLPAVRERLLGHRLDYPGAATDPAFPTRTGRRQHPDNVRARILAPIRERANELLAAEGRLPIRHLTPHTLRRTFASILAVCNVPPRRAMYLLGHADPTLTLAVYQQVLDMRSAAVAELEETIGVDAHRGARDPLRARCRGPGSRNESVMGHEKALRARRRAVHGGRWKRGLCRDFPESG
jgi:integrase